MIWFQLQQNNLPYDLFEFGLNLKFGLKLKVFKFPFYLGYLQLLRPILSSALWWIALSGCIGLTVQLSLLQDLISMMTLHIYCFYVYAAR